MANDIEFKLGLKGRVAQAYRGVASKISNRNKQIRSSMKRAGDAAKKFAFSLKGVAVAAGGLLVFRKITNILKESVKLFDIQIKAERQLEVALGRTSKGLLTQASALQKVTLFGDEATIQAQALIAAMVKEEDQIKEVIPLVQDFATAKGMQLSAAADLVSKTLGSSTNAMSRYGIQVEGAVGSTERLESLTKGLEKAFGGSAEAAAKAGSGPLTQLQNRMGDTKELLGKAFLPLIIKTSEELEKMFSAGLEGDDLEKRFEKLAGIASIVVGSVKDTINTIAGLFQLVAGAIDTFIGNSLGGISFLVMGIRKTIELLPEKFVPDGWLKGIENAEIALRNLGEAGIQGGKDLFNEGIASLQNTGSAIAAWDAMGQKAEETAEKVKKISGAAAAPTAGKGAGEKAAAEPVWLTNAREHLKVSKELEAEQEELIDKYIAKIQEGNMALSKTIKDGIKLRREQAAAESAATISVTQSVAGALAQAFPKMKAFAITSALIDTYASANAAYKAMAGIPVIGPGLGIAAATAATIAGLANVAKIKSAATGADFVTQGPQFIKVGDNPTGRERVQVTPIGSPNLKGPQGGGGVSIAGNVEINVSSIDPLLAGETIQEKLFALNESNAELSALDING